MKTGFNSGIDKRIVFETLQFFCGHMETKAFGIKLYGFPNKNTMARTIEIKKNENANISFVQFATKLTRLNMLRCAGLELKYLKFV